MMDAEDSRRQVDGTSLHALPIVSLYLQYLRIYRVAQHQGEHTWLLNGMGKRILASFWFSMSPQNGLFYPSSVQHSGSCAGDQRPGLCSVYLDHEGRYKSLVG